uniref:Secreted protein n=1 Tax=Ixodes ricinus TaxID=34613 RepID=A0A6B0UR66_IXORI
MGMCALITLGFLVPSTECEKQTKEAFSRVTTVCSEFLFLSLVPFMEVLYSVSGWLLLLLCRISFPSYFVHGHCMLWLQRNGTACRVIGVLTQATFFLASKDCRVRRPCYLYFLAKDYTRPIRSLPQTCPY